jgi:hypothetical protein
MAQGQQHERNGQSAEDAEQDRPDGIDQMGDQLLHDAGSLLDIGRGPASP